MTALAPLPELDPADAAWLAERTDRILGLCRRTTADMLETGAMIAEVKARLGHGHFLAWVEANLPFSRATAFRMMAAAAQREMLHGEAFDVSAAYILTQPGTPDEARKMARELAAGGHRITKQAALNIIRQTKPAPAAAPAPRRDDGDGVGEAIRLLLPAGGERTARLTLDFALDPDDDLVVTGTFRAGAGPTARETGRDVAGVLAALARPAPAPAAVDVGPGLIAWAEGVGGGVARDVGLGGSSRDDIKAAAVAEMVRKAGQFDPARVPPGGDVLGQFKGWAHPSIQSECRREAERIRNGGVYRTSRDAARPRTVGRYEEGKR